MMSFYSHEVLVNCGMSYNNGNSMAGSSRSLNRQPGSPTSNITEDPTFWAPQGVQRQCSDPQSDDSSPQSPNSPTSSNRSLAISVNSMGAIARSDDRHRILISSSPVRPKVASMQAKLDHTKIDTSLYQVNLKSL